MLKLKSLSIKNFMSFGNVRQTLPLNTEQLTLVLGDNLDVPSNSGSSRNGVGKSSILNAICFALYGQSLSNIRKDNLVNLTNEKNMEVILEFEKDGNNYRIERGRKPNYFRFFIGDKELTNDEKSEISGENEKDEAQGESKETQKEIERIIGVSSDLFKQIIGLNTYSLPFLALPAKNQRDIVEELLGITQLSEKAEKLKELLKVTKDLITEEEFKIKAIKETNGKIQSSIDELREKSLKWDTKHSAEIEHMRLQIETLLEIDVESDIVLHKNYEKSNSLNSQLLKSKREKTSKENNLKDLMKRREQYQLDLTAAAEHSCPTCHQEIHDQQQEDIRKSIEEKLLTVVSQIEPLEKEISNIKTTIDSFDKELKELGVVKKPFYSNIDDAYNHRTKLDTFGDRLQKSMDEKNPLDEHIIGQQEALLQKVDLENLQQLTVLREHQEFLLKLLTSKDSAVRKKIIDQNLNYLNHRLGHYVEKLGLPHNVTFMNDLNVMIAEHGRELDFDNLSRGEKTRLILGLSFSFRDVYESLNSTVNLLYLDEIVDLGLDGAGLEYALELLKKMSRENNRSIFLVSHKEELIPRVNNTLTVIKENGFSSFTVGEGI
jgi:DNA repair exonuclease SbcCD ATPase subunit